MSGYRDKPGVGYGLFNFLTAPLVVVPLIWLVALAVYFTLVTSGADYAYFNRLVSIEGSVDDANWASFAWLTASAFAFVVGVMVIDQTATVKAISSNLKFNGPTSAVRVVTVAFSFTAVIAFLWVGGAIIQFGGLGSLIALAANENNQARDVIVSASFPGGRLVSSGFIGIAVYSAAIIASGRELMARNDLFRVAAILVSSLLYLGVIPILVSGRVNFFVAVIGAFVASTYSSGKSIPFKYLFVAVILLSLVWTAKQYFTLSQVMEEASASEQGVEGLLFYVYNDVLNALNTLGNPSEMYTWGWYSIRFIFYFTFTDKQFLTSIYEARLDVGKYVTAGEVPMLAAPIVDFGYAGFFILVVFGAWSQYWYRMARCSLQGAAIYGMTVACLLLSVHANFLTSQEVAYSILLVALMCRASQTRAVKIKG